MFHSIKSNKDIDKLVDYLKNSNWPIDVYSERKVEKRTNPQNKFLHGILLRSIAKYLGWTLIEIKGMMSIRYALVDELPEGTNPDYLDSLSNLYHIYYWHGTYYVTEKSSLMSVERKMRFINDIIDFADNEFGLKFSQPSDDYLDEYQLKYES